MRRFLSISAVTLFWLALVPGLGWAQRVVPENLTLGQISRVYGLSVASSKSGQLHLATPRGLFLANPDGSAIEVVSLKAHLMGFSVHPSNPRQMLAAGHEGQSGSIGVLLSKDRGQSWKQISKNGAGQVGFHILEISKANPNTVYGVVDDLRVSKDGGRTWRVTGPLPRGLIHFAASAKRVTTLYAATREGLLISRDQGVSWHPANLPGAPASMVHVTKKGKVYVFVVGHGLMTATESGLKWKLISSNFLDRVLLRLTTDPANPNRLFAATVTGAVVTSADGGKSWIAFEGSHNANPETIAKGSKLFNTYCQACHGVEGKGQRSTPGFNPANPPAIAAPALDDSDHGWHHSDSGLVNTILNGSPRKGSPMIAWKGQLSRNDAESLVAYIKSLWNFRSIACQGARHMACMRRQ